MIIHSIRVRNFLSHADSTVVFTDRPLWLISGENGAGKSAFFDALEYALYGVHRAQKQHPELLVRNSADVRQAAIEVHFELDGVQYQISHTIRKTASGNQGGRLRRLADGAWHDVNVGPGRRATWDYLERRLPPWELFRSAIFLRQGDIDRFLQGSAAERVNRFAQLIDLSRYTQLSKSAIGRMQTASSAKQRAADQRDMLGDVSDAALEAAQTAAADAERAGADARTAVTSAAAAVQGAQAWAGIRTGEQQLVERRERVRLLLADADAIREAARRVERWDHYVLSIDGVRLNRTRAMQERKRAADSSTAADAAAHDAVTQREALTTQTARRGLLESTELPAARANLGRLRDTTRALGLERQIAEARAALATADSMANTLTGADVELAGWQAAERALPLLDALVRTRHEAASAKADAQTARDTLAARQSEQQRAKAEEAAASDSHEAARSALGATDDDLHRLAREESTIQDRITRRETVGDQEDTCPTCAQPLDEAAHAHLQRSLADDRAQLISVRADRARADAEKQRIVVQVTAAAGRERTATRTREAADTAFAVAGHAVASAEESVARTATAAAQAERAAREANAADPAHLASISASWLAAERRRVTDALAAARTRADELAAAQHTVTAKRTALTTLRAQRTPDTDTPGDSEGAEALTARAESSRIEAEQAQAALKELESALAAASAEVARIGIVIATLETQARAHREEAARAESRAADCEREADQGAAMLGPTWADVLASDAAYQAELAAVQERRTLAERAPELQAVAAEQEQIDRAADSLRQQAEQLEPTHERPVADAVAAHEQAQTAERACIEHQALAKRRLDDLVGDRRLDAELAQKQDEAAEQERTYRTLAELLKEGGPIQVALAGQEQRRIVEEVNSVLERLGDTLRADLGTALRARATGIDDIHIVETLDPSNTPRFFEYLSGGEQFRIALALALALHRRVGKQAGTLIVDEGFGALDSRRRQELAARLTDTTDAILDQGLAHSMIICSHSEEVQRQFADRWHVHKQGDAATVTRIEADGMMAVPEAAVID